MELGGAADGANIDAHLRVVEPGDTGEPELEDGVAFAIRPTLGNDLVRGFPVVGLAPHRPIGRVGECRIDPALNQDEPLQFRKEVERASPGDPVG